MTRALAALTLIAALGTPCAAQTADEIVARSIEARGGMAAIRAIQSVRMSGRMAMGPVTAPLVVEIKRGAGLRTEISLPEGKVVQGFDGRTGWGIPPGSTQPESLPEEAAGQLAQQVDFEGALVDYAAKGHKVELVGREKGPSGELHRLRVTLKSGDVDDYLIDGGTWLLARVESKRQLGAQRVEGQTSVADYVEAGGWKWPRLIENAVRGRDERQSIRFEKIEINAQIDESRFKVPANAVPASRRRPGR